MTLSLPPTGAGNVTTASGGTVNNLTVNKPTNTADGDTLIIWAAFRNAGAIISPPAGWTIIGTQNTTNEAFAAYYKTIPTASAESATSYNFTVTGGSSRAVMICFRVPGLNFASMIDAVGSFASYTGSTSVVLPGITAAANTLLFGGVINNTTVTTLSVYSAPSGMTMIGQQGVDNGAASHTAAIFAQVISASGATGSKTATISPAAANVGGYLFTLKGVTSASTVHPLSIVSNPSFTAPTGTVIPNLGDGSDSTKIESGILTATPQVAKFRLENMTPAPAGLNLRIRTSVDVDVDSTVTLTLKQ
jgi:hypothetical protein